jgi:dipeptidyl aminopeptidase/acylaminoacyl peptidase
MEYHINRKRYSASSQKRIENTHFYSYFKDKYKRFNYQLYMKKTLYFSFFLLLAVQVVFAQKKKNLSPETLWDLKRIHHEFSLSETEGIVTLTVNNMKTNESNKNIHIINYETGALKELTKLKGRVSQVVQTPDKDKIGFLYKGHWYEFDLKTKKRKNLLNFSEPIGLFKYSPSSTYAFYSRDVKVGKSLRDKHKDLPHADVKIYDDLDYRHWSSWNNEQNSHIIVESYNEGRLYGEKIDILRKEAFDVPTKPFGGVDDVVWHPNGKEILYVCKKLKGAEYASSTNTDLYLYNLRTRKTKNLTAYNKGYDTHPSYSKSGKHLVWLQMDEEGYESDKNNIIIRNNVKKVSYNLTKAFSETVYNYKWSPDYKTLYFEAPKEGSVHIFKIDLTSDFNNPVITQISKGHFNHSISQVLDDKLIIHRQDMNHATEIYFMDFNGNSTPISHVNDDIYNKTNLSKIEKRWITTKDGKQMLTWVIYPPNFDASKKYPSLLYCQGGPQAMVSQFYSFRWNFQLMAAQGYIVIAPNRRGLPGFGEEWNKAISKDWAGKAMEDYLTAVDAMKSEPFIDSERIGAVGASYGGYSVYMLAGIHQNRFKSFIAHCGLFNLESWYGSTEELFFANYDIGGPYWEPGNAQHYINNSPHKFANNWNTPIMVIHGGKDYRVPDTQGMEAYQVARVKGIKSRFLYFPNESHWVLAPQNSLLWHREFSKWLEETL